MVFVPVFQKGSGPVLCVEGSWQNTLCYVEAGPGKRVVEHGVEWRGRDTGDIASGKPTKSKIPGGDPTCLWVRRQQLGTDGVAASLQAVRKVR